MPMVMPPPAMMMTMAMMAMPARLFYEALPAFQ
jgi:hypothetical protein